MADALLEAMIAAHTAGKLLWSVASEDVRHCGTRYQAEVDPGVVVWIDAGRYGARHGGIEIDLPWSCGTPPGCAATLYQAIVGYGSKLPTPTQHVVTALLRLAGPPKAEPAAEGPRGLRLYLTDTDGPGVEIQQSSAVEPHVWLRLHTSEGRRAALLNVDEAEAVVVALQAFITDAVAEQAATPEPPPADWPQWTRDLVALEATPRTSDRYFVDPMDRIRARFLAWFLATRHGYTTRNYPFGPADMRAVGPNGDLSRTPSWIVTYFIDTDAKFVERSAAAGSCVIVDLVEKRKTHPEEGAVYLFDPEAGSVLASVMRDEVSVGVLSLEAAEKWGKTYVGG